MRASRSIETLTDALKLSNVATLTLEMCAIGDRGAAALAAALPTSAVTHLSLRGNAIGDAGVLDLVKGVGRHSCKVVALRLEDNPGHPIRCNATKLALCVSTGTSTAESLIVKRARPGGVEALALALEGNGRRKRSKQVHDLALHRVDLSGADCQTIFGALGRSEIRRLTIEKCGMGDAAAELANGLRDLERLRARGAGACCGLGLADRARPGRGVRMPAASATGF